MRTQALRGSDNLPPMTDRALFGPFPCDDNDSGDFYHIPRILKIRFATGNYNNQRCLLLITGLNVESVLKTKGHENYSQALLNWISIFMATSKKKKSLHSCPFLWL